MTAGTPWRSTRTAAWVLLLLAALAHPDRLAAQTGGFSDLQTLEPETTPTPSPAPLEALPPVAGLGDGSAPPSTESATSPTPVTLAPVTGERKVGGVPVSMVTLLGIGGIVMVATVIVTLAVLMKNPVVINVPSRSAAGTGGGGYDGPAPAEWIDGGAVRMGRPPEGTLKILPGRFVVEDADRQVELRIFRTSGNDRVETTIGREAGSPYRHIQLNDPSVSSKHAKLVYDKGAYSIINYSRTNPTKVNGAELEENASRRLVDDDRLEIGQVTMTYFES